MSLAPGGLTVERSAPPWSGDDVVGLALVRARHGRRPRAPAGAPGDRRRRASATTTWTSTAATRRGIWVCNVPDYCVDEMADHALALLLALVRGVVELDRSVRAGRWDHDAAGPLRRVSDVRLGVDRVRAHRPRPRRAGAGARDGGLRPRSARARRRDRGRRASRPAALDRAARGPRPPSRVHAPLTDETRGLIGARELALLPEGAFVVNARARRARRHRRAARRAREPAASAASRSTSSTSSRPRRIAGSGGAAAVVTPHAGWYSERREEEAHPARGRVGARRARRPPASRRGQRAA